MLCRMIAILIALVAVVIADPAPPNDLNSYPSRIIGGHDALIEDFPWQASLRYDGTHVCGGVVIDAKWVLTAARCVDGFPTRFLSVLAGATRLSQAASGQVSDVTRYTVHSGYHAGVFININDIALIELSSPFSLGGSVQSVPVAPASLENVDGFSCTITGWGYAITNPQINDTSPDHLQAADQMIVMTTSQCQAIFHLANDSHICVSNQHQGACNGDSGGPLVCEHNHVFYLYGVSCFGRQGCEPSDSASVYSRVPYFRDWVRDNAGIDV